MAKTGMTRRIDELGRLVIPKEIRRNLKIKDNDQIEINVIDNKILLNKYDNHVMDEVINNMLSSLRKKIDKNILFTSRDKIIDYKLLNKEKIDSLSLNEDIMNIIEKRGDVVNYNYKDLIYSIFPLIINGDLYGSLIINSNTIINKEEKEIISFCKMFLENYLE